MKRLVLVLALALVLVGSASAEPLATYEHKFDFSESVDYVSGEDLFASLGVQDFVRTVYHMDTLDNYVYNRYSVLKQLSKTNSVGNFYLGSNGFVFDSRSNFKYVSGVGPTSPSSTSHIIREGSFINGLITRYGGSSSPYVMVDRVYHNGQTVSIGSDSAERYTFLSQYVGTLGCQLSYSASRSSSYPFNGDYSPFFADFQRVSEQYASYLSTTNPNCYVSLSFSGHYTGSEYQDNFIKCSITVVGYSSYVSSGLTVDMVSNVEKPFFDLFGMRGLTASFTPSNPDEDYYILFAGSDSWVGQNPDKWVWTRVHGSTDKYKIIFSGNSYTWFVKYNDEIQQFSFTYTGEEGVVPPVIVPDPEPEPPVTPPIIETPGEADPDYPSMPDLDSPDLTVDFTSGFDEYENMTIYQDVRNMIDGFTSSIAPNIETTQLYQSLQQVIAYLQLVMEQLKEKYAVPIYNILASVSSFVPSICWLAVDIAVIFGMFRFVVHIVTGPISSAIRERF